MTIRLYLPQPLCVSAFYPLGPEHGHYLLTVMRQKIGGVIHVFNGTQGLWRAVLSQEELPELKKSRTRKYPIGLYVQECLQAQPEPSVPVKLYFSPIKRQNGLIEEASALGVTDFQPIVCQHACLRDFSLQRHSIIAMEACEQSHRLTIPRFHPILSIKKALEEAKKEDMCSFSLESRGHVNIRRILYDPSAPMEDLRRHSATRGISLWIGPEGGWSEEEKVWLGQSTCVVSMGAHILRSETAACAAMSILTTLLHRLDESH